MHAFVVGGVAFEDVRTHKQSVGVYHCPEYDLLAVGAFLLAAAAGQKVRQRITALKIRVAQIQEVYLFMDVEHGNDTVMQEVLNLLVYAVKLAGTAVEHVLGDFLTVDTDHLAEGGFIT